MNDFQEATYRYYDQNAQRFFAETVNLNVEDLYWPFLSVVAPHGSILDAGCGSGRDSRYFRSRGYRVTAFDGSKAMALAAQAYLGQTVICCGFDELPFHETFDGIWACASLLHIPTRDLPPILGSLSCVLKSGGSIFLSFKYGTKEGMRDGRWFSDQDERSATDLLRQCPELELACVWRTEDVRSNYSQHSWLNVLARRISES